MNRTINVASILTAITLVALAPPPIHASAEVQVGARSILSSAALTHPPGRYHDHHEHVNSQTQNAIKQFQDRVQQRPDDIGSLLILGQLYLRHARESGEFQAYVDAEETFRRVTKLDPDNDAAIVSLGNSLATQHRFSEALHCVSDLLETNPAHAEALLVKGDALLELGKYADAQQSYAALPEHMRTKPSVLVRFARLHELQGDYHTAIELAGQAYEEVEKLGGEDEQLVWYAWRLGTLQFAAGECDNAEKSYKSAISLDEDDPYTLASMAELEAARGNLDDAVKLYEEALAISHHPPFMTALSDIERERGNAAKADELINRAEAVVVEERKDEQSAEAHAREAAEFYANYGNDPEKAIELAASDVALRPEPFAHSTLAWAYYRDKQFDKAEEYIQYALEGCPNAPTIQFRAGIIQRALGNHESATQHLERAIEINPHFSFRFANEARTTLDSF